MGLNPRRHWFDSSPCLLFHFSFFGVKMNSKPIIAILLSVVLVSPLFGQLITASDVIGIEQTEQVKTYRLDLDADGVPDLEEVTGSEITSTRKIPAKLIEINTLAANVKIAASDQQRNPVVMQKLSTTSYLITTPGRFWVQATAIDFAENIFEDETAVVTLGKPDPGSDAVVADDLRVLVVYETADLSRQKYVSDIIASPLIRNYLRDKASGGFRFLDQHTQFVEPDKWSRALERPRESLPWAIVANSESAYEGPLPADVSKFLDLLKKYGG